MVGTSFFWKVYGLSSSDLNLEMREERVLLLASWQTARSGGACHRIPTLGFFPGDPLSLSVSFFPPFLFDVGEGLSSGNELT